MTPPWWQNGIIYQIYPRSFADSNSDGIGDLNGITGKLDYLVQLGVDAIWLSPIYPSPDVDFGYDVADYCGVDPKFGSMADFDRLVEEAHTRGIHVILDLVLNHTSDQHPWFVESRSSRENPKRDWYIWADPKPGKRLPNNWQSVFGGSSWELDPATGQFYFHMFTKQQPDLNWHNPAVQAAMLDIFRFWMERGVDGFRLDVFNVYFKHPELLDNPRTVGIRPFDQLQHINDCDRPEMIPMVQQIRAVLDEYSNITGRPRYVVGETFISNSKKAASYCGPQGLHAAFNFETLNAKWSGKSFSGVVERWEHTLGPDSWPNYVLNNHDITRSATRYAPPWWIRWWESVEGDKRMKVAAAMLLTLRGTPFLYYGEEIGMRDIPIRSKAEVQDPVGKHYWPVYKGRDGCRSPMQWDASENAGFTCADARPWLPVHPNFTFRNVQAQSADSDSLFNFYRSLIALRRATPALTEGMYQPVTFGTQYIMAYLRQTAEQTVLVALNFFGMRKRLVLGSHLARGKFNLLLSTHRDTPPRLKKDMLTLEPYEALILEIT